REGEKRKMTAIKLGSRSLSTSTTNTNSNSLKTQKCSTAANQRIQLVVVIISEQQRGFALELGRCDAEHAASIVGGRQNLQLRHEIAVQVELDHLCGCALSEQSRMPVKESFTALLTGEELAMIASPLETSTVPNGESTIAKGPCNGGPATKHQTQ